MNRSSIAFAVLYLINSIATTTVQVNHGWLKGEILEAVTRKCSFHSFKGIPYARPPVGTLRFKAPEPPLPWSGTRDATKHGAECTQYNFLAEKESERYIGEEDCLFLNVYSPDISPKVPLPVVIFIHGGAFSSGSGNDYYYGPDFLVCEEVIVVTINYRLGALGFLSMDTDEVPGNAGMKDQVAAFIWVRDNIKYFGGDPNKVTIMGQSAGATTVGLHLLSPMSSGLFQRAILMSGAPMCDFATPFEPKRRAFELGKKLGLTTRDPEELLKFLQSVPANTFMHVNGDLFPSVIYTEQLWKKDIVKLHVFTPVLEVMGNNSFLRRTEDFNTYTKAINRRLVNKVDILIGHTDQETSFIVNEDYLNLYVKYPELLVPKQISLALKPDAVAEMTELIHKHYFDGKPISVDVIREFITYSNDVNFIVPIRMFMNQVLNSDKDRTYFYTFSCVSDRNYYNQGAAKYGLHGASHLDDLMYLFDAKKLNVTIDQNSREYRLIQMYVDLFANFIKYGNPTPEPSFKWPEYDDASKMYVNINDNLTIRRDPDAAAFHFWNPIYKSVFDI